MIIKTTATASELPVQNESRSLDLHAHTTASDGELSPTELVTLAKSKGLTALGITDHDTCAGIAEAQRAAKELGIEIVPGIELSAHAPKGQCHLLGYLIDPESQTLNSRLKAIIEDRNRRNGRICEKLRALGCQITEDEVRAEAGGKVVARPHFARVMVRKGFVDSIKEAFDIYLGEGKAAYVPKDRLSAEEAISLVHQAGGLVFLAHPLKLEHDPEALWSAIVSLRQNGLDGIEARYNLHSPDETLWLLDLADELGMLTCGGSDFHGPKTKPKVYLGEVEHASAEEIGTPGMGKPAPDRLLEELRNAARQRSGMRNSEEELQIVS